MLELFLESPNVLQLRKVDLLHPPKDNEVKVKIIYGGICGSDLRVYKGKISYAAYPLRPGHEVLGTVIEAGKNSSLKAGTKVVVFPNTFCGECEFCLDGKTNICKFKKPLGVSIEGVFAQEIIIDSKYVVALPEEIPNERAILVEPLAVTVHALKKASIGKGTSVAVVGCGTEGLLAIALAKKLGAKLTVIDINPIKLEIAKEFGDVRTIHPQSISDETFDVVIEAAGEKSAIEQAMSIVKPGGVMIALGLTGEPVNLWPMHIVRSEITIYGTIIYTLKDFDDAIACLRDTAFNVGPIISKFVPLSEFQAAFDDALTGNFAKIVLVF